MEQLKLLPVIPELQSEDESKGPRIGSIYMVAVPLQLRDPSLNAHLRITDYKGTRGQGKVA
ncbi:MAG: hypothetical protein DMG13_26120 [Acidobacteria bacterium]|nr:MAG: hypothetical protein DMG13_26120 [Acidobacteriota bacterium]